MRWWPARRVDLPLDRDASARYLPWVVGVMVLLATLALAAALVLGSAAAQWRGGLTGSATIQIPANPDPARQPGLVADVVALATRHPGVQRAEALAAADSQRLLAPWLGEAAAGLALPSLVDLGVDRSRFDASALQTALTPLAPGALVDDHRQWIDGVSRTASLLEVMALTILALVGAVAVASVAFAVRSGMSAHRDAIEVLHLIGARDGTIANAFARHALLAAGIGGVGGWGLAAAALWAIGAQMPDGSAGLPAMLHMDGVDWVLLTSVPAIAAVLSFAAARLAALAYLRQLP
ncbi:MAG: FtsX-like permease family protein [Alphaproteobacteria bacterium]|nr:FtsX-like permease family protein [Alphaproteobacteria bacterium]